MKPSVRLLAVTALEPDFAAEMESDHPLKLVEYAGRWDYGPKSIDKMDPKDLSIIRRWIDSGEESMVEMVDAVFFIECSRVVSHELVRHRIASYQQESQRFVSYEDEQVEDLFYTPESQNNINAYEDALYAYRLLRKEGVPKQIARYVLPNATRTRIIAKMNLRSWRHILKLRMHSSAQPEMQEVARQIHSILLPRFPEVFGDIDGKTREAR